MLWRKCGCWQGGRCCGENVDVSRGVGVVEKMWMCGYRPWGGSCGENVYVGSGVDDVEKTWLCGCGQQ